MTLNSIEPVSNAVVYTSKATENVMENTTIQCSDGGVLESINVTIKSPSSPLWAYSSACDFSNGSLLLSWNAPSVAPECCAQYTVQLSTGSVYNTSETSATVPIGKESVTGAVNCVDHVGEMVKKTEDITINTNIAIELTIEPVNSSCDANATYQISWTTDISSQDDECTPPIINSTIMCTTSSTNQSSNNTRSMNCSVPANETISATVTITNAVGVTASKSASADVLAQACQMQRLNSPVNQLSPAGIAAVVMGVLNLLVLAVVCSACLVLYIRKYISGSLTVTARSSKENEVKFEAVNQGVQVQV